ncbi:MBL fold metallo-hydrolase [Paracidovorax sp. MALMAid1276]|uniref:MBL fold metallo-hydrolase n=1 Tax=Paracidovorax sp. MALMAid1276 TaxID=3411631 RepID=UPI003B9D8E3B
MLRFKNLGSGSTGNATVVEGTGGSRVSRLLVDSGFGIRQLQSRLAQAGLRIEDIDAVFITHEHSDHIGCAQTLAVRHGLPVWMSAGTHAALGAPDLGGGLRVARDMEPIDLPALSALPFTVPHDAREPLQLRCTDGTASLAVMTDLGHASDHVLRQLEGCDAMMIEANHDPELLAASSYPAFLKRRVGGRFGHLANAASAGILRAVRHDALQCVVAAHLSARNNAPALARRALSEAMGWHEERVVVADPLLGTDWLGVG